MDENVSVLQCFGAMQLNRKIENTKRHTNELKERKKKKEKNAGRLLHIKNYTKKSDNNEYDEFFFSFLSPNSRLFGPLNTQTHAHTHTSRVADRFLFFSVLCISISQPLFLVDNISRVREKS